MDPLRFAPHPLCRVLVALIVLGIPEIASAQRELYWADIDVDAVLAADGTLRVAETQTMVFTGDWNGGERTFNLRPRQVLTFVDLSREVNGAWRALTEDDDLDDRDEFAWTDRQTLRWRSREAGDNVFRNTAIRYRLRYELRNILLKDGDGYLLDHDFLFPDRSGTVLQFGLRLRLDPAWQARTEIRAVYRAEKVPPDRGYVLTIPLSYLGAGTPQTLDTDRPPAVAAAVTAVAGFTVLVILWLFVQEQRIGRFAPVHRFVDDAWLREHLLMHPAEVVGAAWDEEIGAPEVVALIARMVSEGKLASDAKGKSSMSLELKVDRQTLDGHERTLVERLFFDGRTTTSTEEVRQHYRKDGFRPADEIKPELQAAVDHVFPPGRPPWRLRFVGRALVAIGVGALLVDVFAGGGGFGRAAVITIVSLVLIVIGYAAGEVFHSNIHWGRREALASLTPALLAAIAATIFLWTYVGTGEVEASNWLVMALAAYACAVVWTTTNAMRSRRHPRAIAFRKQLAAAREHFKAELVKETPALRDEWMPWLLAFGLGPGVDDWSARHAPSSSPREDRPERSRTSGSAPSTSLSGSSSSLFSGGRSGGAGGGASWTAAASGLAAGVSPPSSSGSSGGGGSSGGSSSGGSSGGGGGGGW